MRVCTSLSVYIRGLCVSVCACVRVSVWPDEGGWAETALTRVGTELGTGSFINDLNSSVSRNMFE